MATNVEYPAAVGYLKNLLLGPAGQDQRPDCEIGPSHISKNDFIEIAWSIRDVLIPGVTLSRLTWADEDGNVTSACGCQGHIPKNFKPVASMKFDIKKEDDVKPGNVGESRDEPGCCVLCDPAQGYIQGVECKEKEGTCKPSQDHDRKGDGKVFPNLSSCLQSSWPPYSELYASALFNRLLQNSSKADITNDHDDT